MNATELATLAMAGVAVLGSIWSVLSLSYKVGRLTGTMETRMTVGETDRTRLWSAIGNLDGKLDRHTGQGHR